MEPKSFVSVCFSDLAGQVRAQAVPHAAVQDMYQSGLSWPIAQSAMTIFGETVDTPWAHGGSLRLVPDNRTEVKIEFGEDELPETFILGNIQTADREYWGGCTRNFLQTVLDMLKQEFRLDVSCSYEHQFSLVGESGVASAPMSMAALRGQRGFTNKLAAYLERSGVELTRIGAGIGEHQFVATTSPKYGVSAADGAVVFRQIAHTAAERQSQRCNFAPQTESILDLNAVVLGIDLFDDGDQVTFDSTAPDGVSKTLGSFIAGVHRHLPALCALTRPSITRGAADKNAASDEGLSYADSPPISINPSLRAASATKRGYSFAFAAADATACPYLQLGSLLLAGILGLRDELPALNGSLSKDGGSELVPETLSDALGALAQDDVYSGAFPDGILKVYGDIRRAEISAASDMSDQQLRDWCRQIY